MNIDPVISINPNPSAVRKYSRALVATLVLLFGSIAFAETGELTADGSSNGPTMPRDELELCGEAKLRVLFWDVYESRLHTPGGVWQPGIRPLKLEIRYLRDIKAQDLVEQTAKEWTAQGISSEQHLNWLDQLNAQWRDVSKGDVISLMISEEGTSEFLFNGEPLGVIEHPQFGEDFAGIWLSDKTTRPELRSALIGES